QPRAVRPGAGAGFPLAAAYYRSLPSFGLAAIGMPKQRLAEKRSPLPFVVSIVALLIMAWVLAGTMGHLGPGQVTPKNGVISGLFVWLGFVITTLSVNYAYGQRKPMLTALDGLHWLGVLVIQGAIIGAMGV